MNQRTLIVSGVVGLIAVGLAAWMFLGEGSIRQEVSDKRPVDVVLDFYDPWLAALRSEESNPYDMGLAAAPILSEELREMLGATEGRPDGDPDPILCDSIVPEQISARPVYETEGKAEVLVSSRGDGATGQALVTLNRLGDGWYIANIECSAGDVAPEREFTFEREGFLLKSVPPPLDSNRWHVVFEENGVPGHVAPLFFDNTSMCETTDGNTAVCDPSQFTEPSKALVQGEMTELGVEVKRVTHLE